MCVCVCVCVCMSAVWSSSRLCLGVRGPEVRLKPSHMYFYSALYKMKACSFTEINKTIIRSILQNASIMKQLCRRQQRGYSSEQHYNMILILFYRQVRLAVEDCFMHCSVYTVFRVELLKGQYTENNH